MHLVGFIIRILNTVFKGGECIVKTVQKLNVTSFVIQFMSF